MTERTIETEACELHYWRTEDRDNARGTLMFLHGLTADHTMFEYQYGYFAGKYNLLAWDAPAHGKSRPCPAFSYESAAEALRRVFEAENIPSAILIGQSLGGFLAQSFIKRYPAMVKAFVSIDSCPYGEDYYSKSDRWWLRRVEPMARLYPLEMLKKAVARQTTATKAGYDNMMDMLSPYGKNELCRLMGIGYAGFLEDNCDLQIPCPVLLLAGEEDRTGKVPAYNRAWAAKTGYPLVWVGRAAHNANVDNPGRVNYEIEKFIEALI